ncbi:MAG: hypothetical protein PUK81_03405 [Firmicutes bacterium]|nr:hypothetical protein [Clostridiales bacterium]MDD7651574.1 hypothetical protein [Bacillota bacterium]
MADWESALIGCPFFRRLKKTTISCEGVFQDSGGTTWFPTLAQRDQVLRTYCRRDYERCPLYRALWEKYGD